jgi:hypothetical protein
LVSGEELPLKLLTPDSKKYSTELKCTSRLIPIEISATMAIYRRNPFFVIITKDTNRRSEKRILIREAEKTTLETGNQGCVIFQANFQETNTTISGRQKMAVG